MSTTNNRAGPSYPRTPSPPLPSLALLPSIRPTIARTRRHNRPTALAPHRGQAQASLSCPHCSTIFASTRSASAATLRAAHLSANHSKPHSCPSCPSTFSRKYDLEKHVLTVHQGSRPWTCTICTSSFSQKHHLRRHIDAVHEKRKSAKCATCGASFTRVEHLRSHSASVHAKVLADACVLCTDRFADSRALVAHLVASHNVEPEKATALAASHADNAVRGA